MSSYLARILCITARNFLGTSPNNKKQTKQTTNSGHINIVHVMFQTFFIWERPINCSSSCKGKQKTHIGGNTNTMSSPPQRGPPLAPAVPTGFVAYGLCLTRRRLTPARSSRHRQSPITAVGPAGQPALAEFVSAAAKHRPHPDTQRGRKELPNSPQRRLPGGPSRASSEKPKSMNIIVFLIQCGVHIGGNIGGKN